MLVCLDNARWVGQVSHALSGGPGYIALTTSRCGLAGLLAYHGVPTLAVDALTCGEAATLVESVLGSAPVPARVGKVIVLVDRCARLPLARRAAAARLAGSRGV